KYNVNDISDSQKIATTLENEKKTKKSSEKKNVLLTNFYQKRINIDKMSVDIPTISEKHSYTSFCLDKNTTTKIFNLQKKYNVSRFTIISTLFSILIYKYFCQREFCIDYPINMRDVQYKSDIVGSFIN